MRVLEFEETSRSSCRVLFNYLEGDPTVTHIGHASIRDTRIHQICLYMSVSEANVSQTPLFSVGNVHGIIYSISYFRKAEECGLLGFIS